ncbi:stalk domain-containing protein [Bacilliculturomica massiliensis]|uniref:stalk domain-containing protein n=1 Tax=Bacilliculturomica massiliensis TaxID=1917867 RepID=UPI0013EF069B|nr:stalk domain-containing protein [Bacilliculturomica massiliensis]
MTGRRMGIAAFLLCCFLLSMSVGADRAWAAEAPDRAERWSVTAIYVDGVKLSVEPEQGYFYVDANGRTMAPLRALAEAMKLKVDWNDRTGEILINGGASGTMVFAEGQKSYKAGSSSYSMDTAPVMIQGRAHVPVRFIVDGSGAVMDVGAQRFANGETYTLRIYTTWGNVTPTAPDWAGHDYAPEFNTVAYKPENWNRIVDFRKRAAAGEDVWEELSAFLKENKDDPGISYEALLIEAEMAKHGYKSGHWPMGGGLERSPQQSLSCYQWLIRRSANRGELYERGFQTLLDTDNSYRYYKVNPFTYKRPWTQYYDNETFLAESCFDPFRGTEEWKNATGNQVYIDYLLRRPLFQPYESQGTVMFDLSQLARGLGYDYEFDNLQRNEDLSDQPFITLLPKAVDITGFPAVLRRYDREIVVTVGSDVVKVDGKTVRMKQHSEAKDVYMGQVAVPMCFITDILGENISFDEERQSYVITKKENLSGTNLDEWCRAMNAVIEARGNGDPYLFGARRALMNEGDTGVEADRKALVGSWNCTNYEEFKTTVDWLMSEGHNTGFKRDAAYVRSLSDQEYAELLNASSPTDVYMWKLTRELDSKWGERGIMNWDLFRVAMLVNRGYGAEYLTAEEALSLLEPAAEALRSNFSNWDEAYENYLDGFAWWSRTDPETEGTEYRTRVDLYQELKENQKYNGVLFDETLFQKPVKGI